jgi:hypothetical protein
MKKINLAIAVITLLLVLLSSYTLGGRVVAQDEGFVLEGNSINCQNIGGNCCGAAGCTGPGTPNGCGGTCSGGGSFTCAVRVNGVCTNP